MGCTVVMMKIIDPILPRIAPFVLCKYLLHDLNSFVSEFPQFKAVTINKYRVLTVRKIFVPFARETVYMNICKDAV